MVDACYIAGSNPASPGDAERHRTYEEPNVVRKVVSQAATENGVNLSLGARTPVY